VYLMLALASTWPLATRISHAVPLGTEDAATVPFASAWALWWTGDRLPHGLAGYWRAPIFAPEEDTFAMSESMTLPGIVVAPVQWAGGSRALAHGLWLLLALVSNGVFGCLLGRRLGASPVTSALGGAILEMSPVVHHELGVLVLVGVFGIAGTLAAVIAFADAPSRPRGAALGLALGTAYLTCSQYTVLAVVAMGPAAVWLLWPVRRARATWMGLALALLVALALIAPLGIAQARAAREHHLQRGATSIAKGATGGAAWWSSWGTEVVPQPFTRRAAPPTQSTLFVGWLAVGLAVVGGAHGVRGRSRAAGFVVASALSAVAWSMLPKAPGIAAALHAVPGLAQIRAFWRVGLVTSVGAAGLSALGLHALQACTSSRSSRVLVWLVGALAVVELWPAPARLVELPDARHWAPLTRWIARRTGQRTIVLHLPMEGGESVEAHESAGRYMLVSTFHGRPLANGYSSYFPRTHRRLSFRCRKALGPRCLAAIHEAGVGAIVGQTRWLDEGERRSRLLAAWARDAVFPGLGLEAYLPTSDGGS